MGRPQKTGLDYFPLDVSFDDNVELLEAECGISGFGIMIKLWQKIYSNGYFVEWEDDNALLFARKINSDINEVNAVVKACLRRSIFNEKLYKKHKILTSRGIQSRYFKAITDSRRVNVIVIQDYFLLTPTETPINTEFIELITEESTQSKVEYKKEDNIKEDKSNCPYNKIKDLYHETCPSLPKVRGITDKRKPKVKQFYEFMNKDMGEITNHFIRAEENDHITKRDYKFRENNKWINWIGDFDYLMKPEAVEKIENGKIIIATEQTQQSNSNQYQQSTGVNLPMVDGDNEAYMEAARKGEI